MDEDILNATLALSLSPRKDRSDCVEIFAIGAAARSKPSIQLVTSRKQNAATAASVCADDGLSQAKIFLGFSNLTADAARAHHRPNMPRGTKRPRPSSGDAKTSIITSSFLPHSKTAAAAEVPGWNAHKPIVISDDEEDDETQEAEPAKLPPNALGMQSIAHRYMYNSPNKARSQRTVASSTLKAGALKSEVGSAQPLTTFVPSSPTIEPFTTAKRHTGVPKSTTDAHRPARKKPKLAKVAQRGFIKLKATNERAKEAGISPLDLSQVSAAGFKLFSRCSFCADAFTKSAAAKVKQSHMSLCAPLQGIKQSKTALDLIKVDIQNALKREEEDNRKALDQRTILQEVLQDADIVMHEGRASQIPASSKKHGKDAVITKKAIRRSTKPPLFVSDQPSFDNNLDPHTATHRLIPARQATLLARDVANQLIGSAIRSRTDTTKKEGVDAGRVKPEALDQSSNDQPSYTFARAKSPSTPKKANLHNDALLAQIDDNIEGANNLPLVSIEQVFASIASHSPQKSPFKALQKSRERQASREHDLSLGYEGSWHSSGSPDLPRTQPFAPSKLAKRQRARDDQHRPRLFGAETTTRSLLDLVRDHRKAEESENIFETKRKRVDAEPRGFQAKRHKKSKSALGSDVKQDQSRLEAVREALEQLAEFEPHAASSDMLGSEMDVDDQTAEPALPAQPGEVLSQKTGKTQEQDHSHVVTHSASSLGSTRSIDTHASLQRQQDAEEGSDNPFLMLGFSSDASFADFEADSIDEAGDDDDSQSFLELLEPLEALPEPAISETHSLSEASSEDLDTPDATETRRNRDRF